VYGFAKDYGCGGFKVGVFFSTNKEVNKRVQAFCHFSVVSTDTQAVLTEMLKVIYFIFFFFLLFSQDKEWIHSYFETFSKRLIEREAAVEKTLNELHIPFCIFLFFSFHCLFFQVKPQGALFLWVDLRSYLKENTIKEEMRFVSILGSLFVCLFACFLWKVNHHTTFPPS